MVNWCLESNAMARRLKSESRSSSLCPDYLILDPQTGLKQELKKHCLKFTQIYNVWTSVVDRHRFAADPDPTFHFDADPDPDPDTTSSITQVGKS